MRTNDRTPHPMSMAAPTTERSSLDATPSTNGPTPTEAMASSATNDLTSLLACPTCRIPLCRVDDRCICSASAEHVFPVVGGIPRFVPATSYADSFGFEWHVHRRTQLDGSAGGQAAATQLTAKTGFSRTDLHGRLVLDAGVGAGRYLSVMQQWGARVVGLDLSSAIEVAAENSLADMDALFVQGDIGHPPLLAASFDAIVSIGVLHHTPDARAAFMALVPLLKSGGTIAIWVYPPEGYYLTRAAWIPFTSILPPRLLHLWCNWYVRLKLRHSQSRLLRAFHTILPVSEQEFGVENDILDTFDGYSPRYHSLHSPDEVAGWFVDAGLEDIRRPSDWLTCMRGRRP